MKTKSYIVLGHSNDRFIIVWVYFASDEQKLSIQLLAGLYCGRIEVADMQTFSEDSMIRRAAKIHFLAQYSADLFMDALRTL